MHLSTGHLDREATVLRFYHTKSPPPLSIGLVYVQNNHNGTYSGLANSLLRL